MLVQHSLLDEAVVGHLTFYCVQSDFHAACYTKTLKNNKNSSQRSLFLLYTFTANSKCANSLDCTLFEERPL